MQLQLLGFVSATQRFAAGAQAATAQALDFTVGSVLRALAEAQAALGLWMQWQVLRVRSMTRLATSTSGDVDSWVGDFGLVRLPGVAATGAVTLSRYSATQGALVLPGTLIRTADNTVTAQVVADTTNSLWSTTAGASPGYFLPATIASATVPAIASVTGQVGNVGAGTLTLLATAVPGIDLVTNAAPFAGGLDAESDAALRSRFLAFIGSLSEATKSAILYAAGAVQQNLALQVVEGAVGSGIVTLYVDDGTGSPSAGLLTQIALAVDAVRPITVSVVVQPPTLVQVNVAITLIYPPGADVQATEAAVSAAVAGYIAGLGLAQSVSYARIAQIALDAAPAGSDIGSLTLNSGAGAIAVGVGQRAHLASLTVA